MLIITVKTIFLKRGKRGFSPQENSPPLKKKKKKVLKVPGLPRGQSLPPHSLSFSLALSPSSSLSRSTIFSDKPLRQCSSSLSLSSSKRPSHVITLLRPPSSYKCRLTWVRQRQNVGGQLSGGSDVKEEARGRCVTSLRVHGGKSPTSSEFEGSSWCQNAHLNFYFPFPKKVLTSSARIFVQKQQILQVDPSQTESYFEVNMRKQHFIPFFPQIQFILIFQGQKCIF